MSKMLPPTRAPRPISPYRCDREFVLQLPFSGNFGIEPEWSKSENGKPPKLMGLRLEGWLGKSDAVRVLEAIDDCSAPGSVSDIMDAFMTLTAVTARPADIDDDKVIAYARRMPEVLMEFPRAVALEALRDWPSTSGGRWWPGEHDLREELDARMQLRKLLRSKIYATAASAEPDSGKRSDAPVGLTAKFVQRVLERKGRDYVYSWLSAESGCAFTDDTVFTVRLGVDKLMTDVGDIADVLHVAIRHCPEVTRKFYAAIDAKAEWR